MAERGREIKQGKAEWASVFINIMCHNQFVNWTCSSAHVHVYVCVLQNNTLHCIMKASLLCTWSWREKQQRVDVEKIIIIFIRASRSVSGSDVFTRYEMCVSVIETVACLRATVQSWFKHHKRLLWLISSSPAFTIISVTTLWEKGCNCVVVLNYNKLHFFTHSSEFTSVVFWLSHADCFSYLTFPYCVSFFI